jgi:hypothetical protein
LRFYKINITNPTSGAAILPSSLGGQAITSLNPDGSVNTSALNVEFDIQQFAFHQPNGNTWIRIWGLGLADIGGAFNLNPSSTGTVNTGAIVEVSAGMSAGLPLANPAQQGLLIRGQVLQAYGNWLGTAQTVDLLLSATGVGTNDSPTNFSLVWRAGTQLADALKQTLRTALPNAKVVIQISSRLSLAWDQVGYYGTLTQLNQYLQPLSKSIITDAGYQGVFIIYDGQTVTASDGTTTTSNSTTIAFTDLIGQPTWSGPKIITIKTVMRGDLDIGDQVTLPPSLVTSSSTAFQGLTGNNPSNNLAFTGPYQIQSIHHYGNFRQPDAASWCSVFEMAKVNAS